MGEGSSEALSGETVPGRSEDGPFSQCVTRIAGNLDHYRLR